MGEKIFVLLSFSLKYVIFFSCYCATTSSNQNYFEYLLTSSRPKWFSYYPKLRWISNLKRQWIFIYRFISFSLNFTHFKKKFLGCHYFFHPILVQFFFCWKKLKKKIHDITRRCYLHLQAATKSWPNKRNSLPERNIK